jgi:hypothetical protein
VLHASLRCFDAPAGVDRGIDLQTALAPQDVAPADADELTPSHSGDRSERQDGSDLGDERKRGVQHQRELLDLWRHSMT